MIWHEYSKEKPQEGKPVVIRDNKNRSLGGDERKVIYYEGMFRVNLATSTAFIDMNNIVYWGYEKDMYKYDD